jgi:hypothetical protein
MESKGAATRATRAHRANGGIGITSHATTRHLSESALLIYLT